MNNKIGIAIAIVVVVLLLGTGIFTWYQFRPQKNLIPILRDQEQVVAAPQAILRGDINLTRLLPIDIKQGYVATYGIFYQDELVGEVSWSKVQPNKTEVISVINIPELYQERGTVAIIHTLDLKPQSRSARINSVGAMDGTPFTRQIDTIVDYDANLVNTTVEVNGDIWPTYSIPIAPNAVNQIDVADLYVGWQKNDIKVVEKNTITVPAGTFDVLVIEMDGVSIFGNEAKVSYYITQDGKIIQTIQHVSPQPLVFPLVFKLKSYLLISESR